MKKLITLIFMAAALLVNAQTTDDENDQSADTLRAIEITNGMNVNIDIVYPDTTKNDTTRIELNNKSVIVVSKSKSNEDDKKTSGSAYRDSYKLSWWNGVDLGVNGILSENHDFKLSESNAFLEPKYGKSRYISFNMGQVKGRIIKDYVGFTMGAAIQIYNYKFDGDHEFIFAGDSLFSMPSGDKNITKNKLRVSYIAVPAMLEFNTSLNPKKSFHVSAGVVGKIRIENMYKQKFSLAGNENKTSIKGDLGINRWAADAILRVGYRRLTAFAQVGLLPLFDNANTDDVYNFAVGLYIKV